MKKLQLIAYGAMALSASLSSCAIDEMSQSSSDGAKDIINRYTHDWIKTFGLIDERQDWNMAELVLAPVDPSVFGEDVTVYIYGGDPYQGANLIGVTDEATTLHLDVLKGTTKIFASAVNAQGEILNYGYYDIQNGHVDLTQPATRKVTPAAPLSRADGPATFGSIFDWMIACEDLGNAFDYDFNDIVIGVKHKAGQYYFDLYPMACGGVLDAEIWYLPTDNAASAQRVGEIHNLLGVGSGVMYNTSRWNKPGQRIRNGYANTFSFAENLSNIQIRVKDSDGTIVITAPDAGTAPQMIGLPDWYWPKENVDIRDAYQDFADWSSDATNTDWINNRNDDLVIKWQMENTIKCTTDDGTAVTSQINGVTYPLTDGTTYYMLDDLAGPVRFNYLNGDEVTSIELANLTFARESSLYNTFYNMCKLSRLTLDNVNTSQVVNMEGTFYATPELDQLDLSCFNTSNATTLALFLAGSGVKSVKLGNFCNTKVTNFSSTFEECQKLTSLDLSTFYTPSATDMSNMFDHCYKLQSIDLSTFDTSHVTTMRNMFWSCDQITSLNLSSFNTQSVTTMEGMFFGCEALTSLDLSNFDTTNVTDTRDMFNSCKSLETLNLLNFKPLNKAGDQYAQMFHNINPSVTIITNQDFKDWCVANSADLHLPSTVIWDIR